MVNGERAPLHPPETDPERVAGIALGEDGELDLTSLVTVTPGLQGSGLIEYRNGGVLAGCPYADAVARVCGCTPIVWKAAEGAVVPSGAIVGEVSGPLRAMLRAERPLLNLLQRAGGIATATRAYVTAVDGLPCQILHTRKTAPGLRRLDISAVLAGGGAPHRTDLATTVLVKDNHWRALEAQGRTLAEALHEARSRGVVACQVEVETPAQLEQACTALATRVLLDNQTPETVRQWAERARRLSPGIEIEASGGITLHNARDYASSGADFLSIGALTHSVKAADLALEVTA